MKQYDIVGDVHGCADQLEALLKKMGYEHAGGYYRHPERSVIFLGDFIDRVPKQADTINIVRPMIDSGSALSVMGNHEFNAICYATETADGHVRPHNKDNNDQHAAFLNEFPYGSDEHKDAIAWFKTLPVRLDLEEIGIVHACWCEDSFSNISDKLDEKGRLSHSAYLDYADRTSSVYHSIERLLKGPEHDLPKELYFKDTYNKQRTKARISWWLGESQPSSERLEFGGATLTDAQIAKLNDHVSPPAFPLPDKLVFIGHYWLKGDPAPLSNQVACVDYSVAKDGKMTAYRWDGEKAIHPDKFVWV